MPQEGSRGIGRGAAVALVGGFITLAATAVGPAPEGAQVTGSGDGHIWADHAPAPDGNPWHGARPWAGLAAGTDGNPWHNLLATDGQL